MRKQPASEKFLEKSGEIIFVFMKKNNECCRIKCKQYSTPLYMGCALVWCREIRNKKSPQFLDKSIVTPKNFYDINKKWKELDKMKEESEELKWKEKGE